MLVPGAEGAPEETVDHRPESVPHLPLRPALPGKRLAHQGLIVGFRPDAFSHTFIMRLHQPRL